MKQQDKLSLDGLRKIANKQNQVQHQVDAHEHGHDHESGSGAGHEKVHGKNRILRRRQILAGLGLLLPLVLVLILVLAGVAGPVWLPQPSTEISVAETTPTPVDTTGSTQPTIPEPTPEPTEAPIPYVVSEKLSKVLDLNPDIVGWIEIPGTKIDYPIVCSQDNEFYLEHDYLGQKNVTGAVMMDFRNAGTLDNQHNLIYAHNMKNGTMFHNLRYFKEKDYALEHDRFFVETEAGMTEWQIFSCYITSTDFYFIQTHFPLDGEYTAFLETISGKSMFDFGETIQSEEQILTLSTCTYEFDDARLVIHARPVT